LHRRHAGKLRLEALRPCRIDDRDAFDIIALRLLEDFFKIWKLGLAGGDHELAGLAVGHAVCVAERIQHAPRTWAVISASRAGGIVKACVDDLAVA
jgi:hypothetical protein